MRILFLTSRIPFPPNRGDRLRAFHFLENLARYHDITLCSFVADEEEKGYINVLKEYCERIHIVPMSPVVSTFTAGINVWRRQPLQVLYYRSEAMKRMVDKVLKRDHFDMAYVHLFRMYPYVAGRTELYRVVDLTDVVSQEIARSLPFRRRLWRWIYMMERPRIELYEQQVANSVEETWLISETDRKLLAKMSSTANLHVVPNGVNLDRFHPTGRPSQPNSLIIVGHMGVYHNVDAATYLAKSILPLVRREIPDCTLAIVGADPIPAVLKLADIPEVTVTGYVPDLNVALNSADVFVAPLRFAAGIQNKVLEAMAAARPVVTTSMISNSLETEPGRHLVVADNATDLADSIVGLLRDKRRRDLLGGSARSFVSRHFNWDRVSARVKAIEMEIEA